MALTLESLILRIKRQETPTDRALYQAAKRAMHLDLPAPRAVYKPLYHTYDSARFALDFVAQNLLYKPMFRSRCASAGPQLRMFKGMPFVFGQLRIHLGTGVTLSGQSALGSGKVFDDPTLWIGDHTYVGPFVMISVCKEVRIGAHCLLADGVFVADNPGHPIDPIERRDQPVRAEQVKPVFVGNDVWIGTRAIIMPGVTIGDGAIVGAGSVVTRDVAPRTIVAGNPARVVRHLDDPSSSDS